MLRSVNAKLWQYLNHLKVSCSDKNLLLGVTCNDHKSQGITKLLPAKCNNKSIKKTWEMEISKSTKSVSVLIKVHPPDVSSCLNIAAYYKN